ncbi:DUF6328 family protein [Streptomyces sp. NPDC056647]
MPTPPHDTPYPFGRETTAVLATPVALHRDLSHRGAKIRIVAFSARLAEVGLVLLALALNGEAGVAGGGSAVQ